MRCTCPDWAGMCKHVAAAMYGVGNRLDSSPELLFVLRGVDHLELIEQAIPTAPVKSKGTAPTIATDELGAIFGIEIGDVPPTAANSNVREKPAVRKIAKRVGPVKKAAAASKTPAKRSPKKG